MCIVTTWGSSVVSAAFESRAVEHLNLAHHHSFICFHSLVFSSRHAPALSRATWSACTILDWNKDWFKSPGVRESSGHNNNKLTLVIRKFPPGSFEQVHWSPKNSHPGGPAMWKMKHVNFILPRDILFVRPWKVRICLWRPFLAEISMHLPCFKLDSVQLWVELLS